MAWSDQFIADLVGNDDETYLERPLQFLICTRPSLYGLKAMPSSFLTEDERGWGWSSLAPRLIGNIADAEVENWYRTDEYSSGADLISYKETAQSITLRTWKPKASSFTFEVLRPDVHIGGNSAWRRSRLIRGMFVEVFAGYEGYTFDEYQRINLGVINSVSQTDSKISIQCNEAWTQFLGPSIPAWTKDFPKMFKDAGRTFQTDEIITEEEQFIDWKHADGDSVAAPMIPVTPLESKSDLIGRIEKRFFCIEVADTQEPTPKNVYLRVEQHDSNTLKQVTDGSAGGANFDWFHHVIGDVLILAGLMGGSPTVIDYETPFRVLWTPQPNTAPFCDGLIDTLKRILVSTGEWTTEEEAGVSESPRGHTKNGSFDTLHAAMGFGLPWQLLNFQEAREWHKRWPKRDLDSFLWTPFFSAETDSGWSVIEKALSHFGVWVCFHQGQYTLRSAISHAYDGEGPSPTFYTITGADIHKINRHEFFSSSCRVEHSRVVTQVKEYDPGEASGFPSGQDLTQYVQDDRGVGEANIATKPFSGDYVVSVCDGPLVQGNPITPTARTCWPFMNKNEDKFAAEFVSLQYQWFTRIPEIVELELVGLKYATMIPGDIVTINSDLIVGPYGAFDNRPAMIQSIRRDWARGRVVVTLASIPPSNRI